MAQLLVRLNKEDIVKFIAERYEVSIESVDILPILDGKNKDGGDIWTVEGFVNLSQE